MGKCRDCASSCLMPLTTTGWWWHPGGCVVALGLCCGTSLVQAAVMGHGLVGWRLSKPYNCKRTSYHRHKAHSHSYCPPGALVGRWTPGKAHTPACVPPPNPAKEELLGHWACTEQHPSAITVVCGQGTNPRGWAGPYEPCHSGPKHKVHTHAHPAFGSTSQATNGSRGEHPPCAMIHHRMCYQPCDATFSKHISLLFLFYLLLYYYLFYNLSHGVVPTWSTEQH